MDALESMAGMAVAVVAFIILFFGFITVPASSSVALAVLFTVLISCFIGFVFQVGFNATMHTTKH